MKKSTKIDKTLLIIMFALLIFGLIMVLSASSMASYMRYNKSIYYYFIRHGIFTFAGLIAFFIALFLPISFFKKISPALIVILLLALFGLNIYGSVFNAAKGWYDLGFMTVQPSEIGKIIIILFMGYYYEKHRDDLDNQWTLLKPIVINIIIFTLVALQPDLGTGLIIVGIVVAIFYVLPLKKSTRAPINKIFIGGLLLVSLIMILTGGSLLQEYQLQRFNFIDPCERYDQESGYQLCNSFIALKNGGLVGKGIGESTQKYLYLPEAHTDFIYSIIVEEWGAVVGFIILILYFIILIRILKIAKGATNLGNSIIAFGVFAYLLCHMAVNLMGVIGIMPLTGVPLPFLSYGGSYMLTLLFSMGLVQRIHYETYKKSKN